MHYLVENYRSSAHIIAAANALIRHNRDRMKQRHPIRINRQRDNLAPGGRWLQLDTLARGRVQQIRVCHEQAQAVAVIEELLRLRQLDIRLEWSQCAVLAKEWRLLSPVRSLLEQHNIPVSILLPAAKQPSPFRIRENAALLQTIKSCPEPLSRAADWLDYLAETYADDRGNPWVQQLKNILQEWQRETGNGEVPNYQTLDFLYETLAEQRRDRKLGQGMFVSTMHSVKGMEFSHVVILDGGWSGQDREEQRRLFYVAMTRARETLCLMQRKDLQHPFLNELTGNHILIREASIQASEAAAEDYRHYAILGLQDLDIGFAGSFKPEQPVHRQLAALVSGSLLSIRNHHGRAVLMTGDTIVARLSQKANPEWLPRLESIEQATVLAMINRYREDGSEDYQSRCKCGQWEVPLVEIMYRSGHKPSNRF